VTIFLEVIQSEVQFGSVVMETKLYYINF